MPFKFNLVQSCAQQDTSRWLQRSIAAGTMLILERSSMEADTVLGIVLCVVIVAWVSFTSYRKPSAKALPGDRPIGVACSVTSHTILYFIKLVTRIIHGVSSSYGASNCTRMADGGCLPAAGVKAYSALPGPPLWPILGNMPQTMAFLKQDAHAHHRIWTQFADRYGGIYRYVMQSLYPHKSAKCDTHKIGHQPCMQQ